MASPSDRITEAEAQSALQRSGYMLESRVEAIVQGEGFYVQANPSYQDPLTSKSREYDLFALAAVRSGPGTYGLWPVLLIECVNNPQPLALITKKPMVPFLHHQEFKVSGLPVKFPMPHRRGKWLGFTDYLGYEKFHHYCKGRIATQYCSFQQKKDGSWMASHDQEHFESFLKLCDVLEQQQAQHYARWWFTAKPEDLNVQMYYPAVVLQGQLWDVRSGPKGVTVRRARHLQYRCSVTRGGKEAEYQIDVLEERYLRTFLKTVWEEAERSARLLRRRHAQVRQAIDKIAARARKARTAEARREAMEFGLLRQV